jgi:hypothetical protein
VKLLDILFQVAELEHKTETALSKSGFEDRSAFQLAELVVTKMYADVSFHIAELLYTNEYDASHLLEFAANVADTPVIIEYELSHSAELVHTVL